MKTFAQLTPYQQKKAKEFAYKQLVDCYNSGLLEFDHILIGRLDELAEQAAEGSQYDDEGNPIVEEVNVPYYFQGGCV
jgi:hypothetical protein